MRRISPFRAMLVALALAALLGTAGVDAANDGPAAPLGLFAEAFERIRAESVEATDDHALLRAAIAAMMAFLDPHSAYLEDRGVAGLRAQMSGSFGGIGIQTAVIDARLTVTATHEDSPARRAGIQPGDTVLGVDGEPVDRLGFVEARARIRGEAGTPVALTLASGEGSPAHEVTLVRELVAVRVVTWRVEGRVAHTRIARFHRDTAAEVEEALAEAGRASPDGLVGLLLDLRDNPGGLVT